MKQILAAALLVLAIEVPGQAFAWGSVGHRTIAALAYGRLTPKAEAEVQSVLAAGAAIDLPSCRFGSFEDASIWPDCVRGRNVAAYRNLRTLHYEDRPLCGAAKKADYCPDGGCLTVAIANARSILRRRTASPNDRALALAELVHFIGDLHQPLHMTDNNDRGGNSVPAFFPNHRAITNLHSVWDDALVKSVVGYRGQRAVEVEKQIRTHPEWSAGELEDWASEFHQLGVSVTYGRLPLRQTCGIPNSAPEVLDGRYVSIADDAVAMQLGRAAVRLASVLNAIFP